MVTEYIKTFPKDVQNILQKIRETIRKSVPEAVETISYQIPAFKLNGKYLIYFAAFKNHIGIYPVPTGNKVFKKEIAPYISGKATMRLMLDKPIPYGLVKKFVMYRMKENLE